MKGQRPEEKGQKEERGTSQLPDFPALEEEVLARWRRDHLFAQTLERTKNGKRFVFFEGPPTANGMPHIGHVETRAFKDVILRCKTMQGFFVERKAGWDTHGLPVEIEVEKQLGIAGKKRIEEFGVARFNELARASVWRYKDLWEQMSERIGFWMDYAQPYVTSTNDYIETLWWICKQAWEQHLLEQDFKVVPYCPRCETALSSHEVAQGYRTVTEPSLYVKFPLTDEPGTSLLAWTTTPWTLPGNVALAVGRDVRYVKVRKVSKADGNRPGHTAQEPDDGYLVLAEDRLSVLGGGYEVVETFLGKELEGRRYTPLFDFLDLGRVVGKQAYVVVPAGFVSTEEGTGIVHTAVMYGDEDFALGAQHGLPTVHTVDRTGRFNDLVPPWQGREARDPEDATQSSILKYLQDRGLVFSVEPYTHDYPFCWRCKHPLLYYAKTTWFLRMSRLREQLIANNRQIRWHPAHVQEGRFGEWLREVKDWALSRERYWGTPLPIWCCDACDHRECVGSMRELAERMQERHDTAFILLRHGDADSNAAGTNHSEVDADIHLTEQGRVQVRAAAEALRGERIDRIISSDLIRTKETAAIVAGTLGLPVHHDARLREMGFGSFSGRTITEYFAWYREHGKRRLDATVPGGETLRDVRRRLLSFIRETEAAHAGERILLVGHGDPFWVLRLTLEGYDDAMLDRADSEQADARPLYPRRGAFVTVTIAALPRNADGVVDLHRPFVDTVSYPCPRCHRGTMRRVPETADAWFDSGSMPFAQWHYPFERKERIERGAGFPADYITEGIDQTRGWFYVLLAVSTVLQQRGVVRQPPYRNVLVLGHVNDAQGRKLSKSLGNYLDPMTIIRRHGADATRFYLFTLNQPWEAKSFDERGVDDVVRKHFLLLWNVLRFLETTGVAGAAGEAPSSHVLDVWLSARTDALVRRVTELLEAYDVTTAARQLVAYGNELSTWYVRRSRDRLKRDSAARAALTAALRTCSVLHAPFTPFFAELLYERVRGAQPSVHLEAWPTPAQSSDARIVDGMTRVRRIAELGHAAREAAGIRVRQPLAQLVVVGAPLDDDLVRLVQEELNVRSVVASSTVPTHADWRVLESGDLTVALDTTITDELLYEGWVRDVIRAVNDMRKRMHLVPSDRIAVRFAAEDATVAGVLERYAEHVQRTTRADGFARGEDGDVAVTITLGTAAVKISMRVVGRTETV